MKISKGIYNTLLLAFFFMIIIKNLRAGDFINFSDAGKDDRKQRFTLRLIRVRELSKNAYFPDIIYFRGAMFIAYREAAAHNAFESHGKVVILRSTDNGESWEEITRFDMSGADLRDPRFCVLGSGRLMVNGGIGAKQGMGSWKGNRRGTFVIFSDDGIHWTTPIEIFNGRDEWMWRGTTHTDGYTYGVVKEQGEGRYRNIPELQYSRLVRTKDGIHYEVICELQNKDIPNEATIRFAPDNTAYIIHRMSDYGLFGKSRPPYKIWTWNRINKIGGPNLILLPGGQWLVGGRAHNENDERKMQLGLLDVKEGKIKPLMDLPSGGDCSYPGFLIHQNKLWVVYYSSHEGLTNLYLAELVMEYCSDH